MASGEQLAKFGFSGLGLLAGLADLGSLIQTRLIATIHTGKGLS